MRASPAIDPPQAADAYMRELGFKKGVYPSDDWFTRLRLAIGWQVYSGFTFESIAAGANMAVSHLYRLTDARRMLTRGPTVLTISRLARATKVPPAWLAFGAGKPPAWLGKRQPISSK